MTLPASGPITLNNVNVELGLAGTAAISLNDAAVRTLFAVPSGTISMSNGYGKSSVPPARYWLSRYGSLVATFRYENHFIAFDSNKNLISVALYPDGYWHLFKHNSAGALQWAKRGRVTSNDNVGSIPTDITTDSSGNIYTTGILGQSNITNANQDWYIIKHNSSGTLQWQKRIRSATRDNGEVGIGIAVDSSGNVYAIGHADTGYQEVFVYKFDSSGNVVWEKSISRGSSGSPQSYDYARSLTIDSSNNLIIVLVAQLFSGDYSSKQYAVKMDTSGTVIWQKSISPDDFNFSSSNKVITDSSNNIYILMGYSGNAIQGGILIKLNSSGVLQWSRGYKQAATGESSVFSDVAVDSSGNPYVTLYYRAGTDNTSTIYSGVVKYNSSGTLQWKRTLSSSTGQIPSFSIAINNDGDIAVGGSIGLYPDYKSFVMTLPPDGSQSNRTFAEITYAPSSFSEYTPSVPSTADVSLFYDINLGFVNPTDGISTWSDSGVTASYTEIAA